MVLPAYRAIGIGLTPITGPFLFAQAAMDLAHLVWGHSLAMTAWPWRHFKGLKVFFFRNVTSPKVQRCDIFVRVNG